MVKSRSEKIYVATKCGRKLAPHINASYTPEALRRFVEDSLKHMELETLKTIDISNSTIVAPQAVAEKLPEKYQAKLKILGNGENLEWSEIGISALPMYNLPESPESRHPKGRGNGYLSTVGGKSVYISGDTGDIPEMRALKNIDVAFVCMNLPYTMDIHQASGAVLDFKPKIVYPFHYRGKEGLSDVETFKNRWLRKMKILK